MCVGRVLSKYKVGKHYALEIGERHLHCQLREEPIAAEACLDGIYVIRTRPAQEADNRG